MLTNPAISLDKSLAIVSNYVRQAALEQYASHEGAMQRTPHIQRSAAAKIATPGFAEHTQNPMVCDSQSQKNAPIDLIRIACVFS
jgi:hypothetical protein